MSIAKMIKYSNFSLFYCATAHNILHKMYIYAFMHPYAVYLRENYPAATAKRSKGVSYALEKRGIM